MITCQEEGMQMKVETVGAMGGPQYIVATIYPEGECQNQLEVRFLDAQRGIICRPERQPVHCTFSWAYCSKVPPHLNSDPVHLFYWMFAVWHLENFGILERVMGRSN